MMHDLSGLRQAGWDDITEEQPRETMTFVEKHNRSPDDFIGTWLRDGIATFDLSRNKKWMALIEAYAAERELLPKDRTLKDNYWTGYRSPCSYLQSRTMLDVALSDCMTPVINVLLGESALLHLALTGWVSTERDWHQDSYLNPPGVWSSYIAAWIALDDIHSDSGPFEFVPYSHLWPVMRQHKLFELIPDDLRQSPHWPTITQGEIARICSEKIVAEKAKAFKYKPRKGEILLWHSNLIHRGGIPNDDTMLRKSLILHYSGVSKRLDMNPIERYKSGFYYNSANHGPGGMS